MKKKIVVIDSNPEYLDMMVDVLEEEDAYEVKSATNGKEGLSLIKSFEPDLVALELFLPGLNGFRLISELKSDMGQQDIFVMVITSVYVGEFEEGKGFSMGHGKYFQADKTLYKPFDEDMFLDSMEELLFEKKPRGKIIREKVLIVDDDPSINKLISSILNKQNYETLWAENGKKGLEMIESEQPDMVLLDIMMPEMNGTEVLEKAVKVNPDLPIIMVTAHGSEDEAVRVLKGGAADYVRKPFNNDELVLKVKENLKKSRVAAIEERFCKRMAETTSQLMDQIEKGEKNSYGIRHIVLTFIITFISTILGLYLGMSN